MNTKLIKPLIFILTITLSLATLFGCGGNNGGDNGGGSSVDKKPTQSQGLEYEINDDNQTVTITGLGTCTDTHLVITDEIDGRKITAIGETAFWECETITKVTVGRWIETIALGAFADCNNLTEIEVNKYNEKFCSIDGNLYSKDTKTLFQYVAGKTATAFEIPNHVRTIGPAAFYGCEQLLSVVIPDSVSTIGMGAFYGCEGITEIVLPFRVSTIAERAFQGCTALERIVMGKSVDFIGEDAFYECDSLKEFVVDESNTKYCAIEGNLYTRMNTKGNLSLIQYAIGKADKSFTLPRNVINIMLRAFANCQALEEVVLSKELGYIVYGAFYNCQNLKTVVLPDNLISIDYYAFDNCTALESIVIPDTVTRMGDGAFQNCTSLTIYCEAEGAPSSWSEYWNNSNCPVVWGYTAEQ